MSEPTQNTDPQIEIPSEFYVGQNIYQTMNVENTVIVFESCAEKEL